jgi:hypothetical protein
LYIPRRVVDDLRKLARADYRFDRSVTAILAAAPWKLGEERWSRYDFLLGRSYFFTF